MKIKQLIKENLRKELLKLEEENFNNGDFMLDEEMQSMLNNWVENTNENGNILTTIISSDEETEEVLTLTVKFDYYENDSAEFSYTFTLMNYRTQVIIKHEMYKREEVAPYLPNDVKKQRLVIPIVFNLTRRLLELNKPKHVRRRTAEKLEGDSLTRYDIITGIFKKFGYEINNIRKLDGYYYWFLDLK